MPGWLTATEAAARLQVPDKWLRKRLRTGAVRTTHEPSGRYLFPDRPEALDALRRLRAGTVGHVDLTESP